jgi:hypothetical protein
MSAPRGAPGAVNVSTSTAKHRPLNAPVKLLWAGKSRASYQQLGVMAAYGGDRRRCFAFNPNQPYCTLVFCGGNGMTKRLEIMSGVLLVLSLVAHPATAASAPPLTEVKVLKVESPVCGFETIDKGQAQTRCNHAGPNIRIYVLEVGYGRSQPHVALDGFEVDGTRTPVCAYDNGNLTDCSQRTKVVGNLYIFNLAGKQEGTFTFSNTSINAPGNTMSTQLYIK